MWWFLSFADGTKPKGTQFLGGVVIEAKDFTAAIRAAHVLAINPGGEVLGQGPFVPTSDAAKAVFEKYRDRLLTKEECLAWDDAITGSIEVLDAPPIRKPDKRRTSHN